MVTRINSRLLISTLVLCSVLCTALGTTDALASSVNTPWPARKPTPALNLTDLDGKTWRTTDLAGKVTVLNFWASWCEPCRDEMPTLARLAKIPFDGQVNALQVLTVNYQESESRVRRFLDVAAIGLPALLDRDGQVTLAWTRRIFPTTVVIDARGQARFTITGEFDWSGRDAEQLLRPLLSAPTLSPNPLRK